MAKVVYLFKSCHPIFLVEFVELSNLALAGPRPLPSVTTRPNCATFSSSFLLHVDALPRHHCSHLKLHGNRRYTVPRLQPKPITVVCNLREDSLPHQIPSEPPSWHNFEFSRSLKACCQLPLSPIHHRRRRPERPHHVSPSAPPPPCHGRLGPDRLCPGFLHVELRHFLVTLPGRANRLLVTSSLVSVVDRRCTEPTPLPNIAPLPWGAIATVILPDASPLLHFSLW
jgi:hypothetical protein